jgi:hypothetical protein
MNIELAIKEILYGEGTIDNKADNVCKFMSWNKEDLISKMQQYGTTDKDAINKIINYFWGKPKGQRR